MHLKALSRPKHILASNSAENAVCARVRIKDDADWQDFTIAYWLSETQPFRQTAFGYDKLNDIVYSSGFSSTSERVIKKAPRLSATNPAFAPMTTVITLTEGYNLVSLFPDWQNEKLYFIYVEDDGRTIHLAKCDYDGANLADIITWDHEFYNSFDAFYDLFFTRDVSAPHNSKIFYIKHYHIEDDIGGGDQIFCKSEIRRIDPDGSGDTLIFGPLDTMSISLFGHPRGLIETLDYVYGDGSAPKLVFNHRISHVGHTNKLRTCNLDGSSPADIYSLDPKVTGLYTHVGISQRDEKIYARTEGGTGLAEMNSLIRMDVDGSNSEFLYRGFNGTDFSDQIPWASSRPFNIELSKGYETIGAGAVL